MEGKNLLSGLIFGLILVLAAATLFFAAGCKVQQPAANQTNTTGSEDLICIPKGEVGQVTTPTEETTKPTEAVDEFPGIAKKYFVEGDLVSLKVKASDADNDKISIKYSKPLDRNGEWQTQIGDARKYLVNITATDGKAETTKQVVIVVQPQNQPPVMKKIDVITVNEGDIVSFLPEVTDPDKDIITITYSGWMTEPSYTTKFGDAGKHVVTITASDGKSQVSQNVDVTVLKGNRAPAIQDIDPIMVTEGETVTVKPNVTDADGDKVTITFGEPLNKKGVWETKSGDAGTFTSTITASDGKAESSKSVSIIVISKNHAPKIEIEDVVVNVGDTVKLEPKVTDKDGDEVTVSYSGWMDSDSKETSEEDIGSHTVTISATDGKDSSNIDVKVTVNTPPEFTFE
jgi:hypothetical protein